METRKATEGNGGVLWVRWSWPTELDAENMHLFVIAADIGEKCRLGFLVMFLICLSSMAQDFSLDDDRCSSSHI